MTKDFPYLTLAYGNGPGFDYHYVANNTNSKSFPWRDILSDSNRLHDPWYQHLATFRREDDTHGGEDVPIYAKGPNSHLIRGVIEQNYIAHVISYSTCIGPYAYFNKYCQDSQSTASVHYLNYVLIICTNVYLFFK